MSNTASPSISDRCRILPLVSSVAVALAIGSPGCGVLKGDDDALKTVTQRVVGMPSGAFFDRYGRATSRSENADGSVRYTWESRVGFSAPGPTGLDERVCRLALTADRQGRMSTVEIVFDAQGVHSTSRCRELFQPA